MPVYLNPTDAVEQAARGRNAPRRTLKSALAHRAFAREGRRIEYITYSPHADVRLFGGETRLVEITFR